VQAPNPGDILLGKYRVEEIIGVGGMGRVVKASHMYLQQPVAIKILLPEMTDSQSTVARFLREAQATVRLRSEHIARVMDVGTMPDGAPFMVMEYLEGHDLNQILRHHGPQLPQAVVDLILQACEGMAEAHAIGIVHRDIKPSNFFITRRPDGSNLLKILDFGISKTPDELSELTGAQTVVGTPTYMAPEQMVSARSTDPRSDIWSIGVVMYQLLAGRPPFEAETYAQLVLKVGTEPPAPLHVPLPPGLLDIVLRCLEKDPNRRIQNVGELARMLAPYASDPMSAQQSAERATRILTAPKTAQAGLSLVGSAGGLTLTPPALTPKSWNQTGGSSVSGSAGQIGTMGTKVVRGGRGMVIAGVATLCVLAGLGGFFVASSMKDASRPTSTPESKSDETATKREMTVAPAAPTAPVQADTTTGAAKVDTGAAKVDTGAAKVDTGAAKVDATKSDAMKTDAAKSDAMKTDAAKIGTTKTDARKIGTTKTDAAKIGTTKTDARKTGAAKTGATKTDAAKTEPTKSDATQTANKSASTTETAATTKTATTKTATKKTTTKADKHHDGLFDERK
jgi:serine/threonine-protein kinase